MRLFTVMLASAYLLAFSAAVVEARTLQQSDPAAVALPAPIMDGLLLFRERGCSHCHEIRGVGGHKGPDLSGVGRRLKKDAIERQITVGGGAMPAFGDALGSDEIGALVKYLEKCRDKTPSGKKIAPGPPASVSAPAD